MQTPDGAEFDFIIVGGGTAGCIIANRLTENESVKVLLIEAGPNPPIQAMLPNLKDYLRKSQYDWSGYSENDGYTQQCTINHAQSLIRGKMLGGSSSINSMIYTRGFTHDYDNWARFLNDSTWNWDRVEPYFLKSEKMVDPVILNSRNRRYHGTTGYLGTKRYYSNKTTNYFKSFSELKYEILDDITKTNALGVSQPILTVDNGTRQSTAYSFLTPILDRKNLFVAKDTTAKRILIDSNNEAYGVEVITQDKKTLNLYAKKEVIVSCGTINSAQLLLLSGIGPKEHLESMNIDVVANLPVGYNFQNQLSFTLTYKMGEAKESSPSDPHEITSPTIIGLFAIDKTQKYADYETYCNIFDNANSFKTFCTLNPEFNSHICDKLYEPVKNSSIFYVTVTMLKPNSKGRVFLKSLDIFDTPGVETGYYLGEGDLKRHVKYLRHFRAIENTTYFQDVKAELIDPTECGAFEYDSDDYWYCYLLCLMVPDHHYSSTCPMGTVVDTALRVYRVKNLRVADTSVVPILVRGHSYAPTMMIAEKVSDMIKNSHSL